MATFGISDDTFLKSGIIIIDGIAGAGKSSIIDAFYRDRNMPYARFTSTNKLRRDAEERYNMPVKTIAAGLFTNHGMRFYAEFKEPENNKVIVIDEVLQTHPRAIEWIKAHSDEYTIIVTTDSKQLLSPENEKCMKDAFDELCKTPGVVYENLTKTLRARDKATETIYNKFYEIADSDMVFTVPSLMETFPNVLKYEDMEYNTSDVYITHDNLTEDFLYRDKGLSVCDNLDLIPKGCLASNPPKDLSKYPLLSQIEAKRTKASSYTQVANIGSPVRFQGTEVMTDQKLYFIVQPTSVITARELYTVITRMWSIKSLVIVVCNTPSNYVLKTFNGLPVKTHDYLYIPEKVEESTKVFTSKQMEEFLSKYDTDEIYYDRDEVRGLNATYAVRKGASREAFEPRKTTAASLAKRDASLNYSYMDEVYSILDKYNIDHTKCIHKLGRHNKENKYVLDLYSAHPTIMKFEKMPIDGFIETDMPHDDMLNFYLYQNTKSNIFTEESIITDDMKNYIEENNLGKCTYLFSTPYAVGCFPGEWLYAKAHDTQESKMSIKSIRYGYYQKPYLKLSMSGDCYVRYSNHIYELLICQIFSQLTFYMMKLYDALKSDCIIIDAVCFECYNEDVLETIKSLLPAHLQFRIKDKDNNTLYKNYPDLPTRAQKKVIQRRESRARKRLESQKLKEDSL